MVLAVALGPCLALLPQPGRARPPSMVAATTDYLTWAADHGIVAPKVALAPESEADERGVVAASAVAAMEVVATVPQELVLSTHAGAGWAGRLTEEVLTSRAQGGEGRRAERPWSSAWGSSSAARRSWVAQWRYTGWSTASEDRVSADERSRFHKDWRSSAGLLTTGSDTDVEIYRKFGLPTHPAIDRASIWLSLLTETSLPAARDALEARGLLSLTLSLALPLTLTRALANPYPIPSANANPHPNPSRYQARGFEWRRCRDTLRPLVDLGDLDLAEEIADAELGGNTNSSTANTTYYCYNYLLLPSTIR